MSADDELLTLLRAVTNLNVHDGYVDADETAKVISVDLPYVVFYAGLGDDIDERMGGRAGGIVTDFQTTYVGGTREQARWAREKQRAALDRKRITVVGKESGLIKRQASSLIRRDDVYTRPGGGPLFYGIDQYSVGSN